MNQELIERLRKAFPDDEKGVNELIDSFYDQDLLVSIGRSLIGERDIDTLLRLILNTSREITGADAGSIFLVVNEGSESRLLFKYAQTYSCKLDYEEFTMPRDDTSIAGYVSLKGTILNIEDAYDLDPEYPFKFNLSFDTKTGYRTKSLLVVPMRNHDDQIIGVLQLINSKEADTEFRIPHHFIPLEKPEDFARLVVPFKKRYENLMEAVANQAAIAIENSRMIERIKRQFESFVRASVFAVESRDPATSGHSERVAKMAVRLARALSATHQGPYAALEYDDAAFREIEYAGLLHDFGKVYIEGRVFLKAKKLYPKDYEFLMLRLKYLYRSIELGYARELGASDGADKAAIEAKLLADAKNLENTMQLIAILNEPQPTDCDPEKELAAVLAVERSPFFSDLDGSPVPVITDDEIKNLTIRRGSLNDEERQLIQTHVTHTYNFVSKIPWPDEFKDIPEITWCHHEMLDGSGYPRGLKADRIPVQSRILAICDVFDALIASDRPYKKALPFDTAKRILEGDAQAGKLDAALVRLFFENECWRTA